MQWYHWQHHWHHVILMQVLMASQNQKKLCHTSFQLSWPKIYNGVIDHTFIIMWCWLECQLHDMIKNHLAPHFYHLGLRNTVFPLIMPFASCDAHWCHYHHMVPTLVPVVWQDVDGSTNGIKWSRNHVEHHFQSSLPKESYCTIDKTLRITWCQCQWHHRARKKQCCTSFQYLDQRNAVLPLVMQLASYDVSAGATDHVTSQFNHLDVIKCTNDILWPRKLYSIFFHWFWCEEGNDAIGSTIGITWF